MSEKCLSLSKIQCLTHLILCSVCVLKWYSRKVVWHSSAAHLNVEVQFVHECSLLGPIDSYMRNKHNLVAFFRNIFRFSLSIYRRIEEEERYSCPWNMHKCLTCLMEAFSKRFLDHQLSKIILIEGPAFEGLFSHLHQGAKNSYSLVTWELFYYMCLSWSFPKVFCKW